MNVTRLCAAGLAVALLAGCPKREGPASPEFEKARDKFFALQASDPLGVFSRPEVKDLLPAMDNVPADSVEKPAAVDLAKTVRDGIAEAEKATADRAKTVAESSKDVAVAIPSGEASPPPPTPSAAPTAVDAGPPAAPSDPGPTAGMSTSDFNAKYGSCFTKTGSYTDDRGGAGETYTLNSTYDCTHKLTSLGQSVVLLSGGKVASIVPKTAVTDTHSFTMSSDLKPAPTTAPTPTAPLGTPPPAPPPPPPVAAAPVLPPPPQDTITTPPADPNVNPDAINR